MVYPPIMDTQADYVALILLWFLLQHYTVLFTRNTEDICTFGWIFSSDQGVEPSKGSTFWAAAAVLNFSHCPNALSTFSRRQLLFVFTFTSGERLFFKMDKRAGQSDRGWLRRNCDSKMTKFTQGYQHGWLAVGHTTKQDCQKLKGLIKITKVSPTNQGCARGTFKSPQRSSRKGTKDVMHGILVQ